MQDDEALLHAGGQALGQAVDLHAAGVRGEDRVLGQVLLHATVELAFDVHVLDHDLDDEVAVGDPIQVVLEVAGLDQTGGGGVVEGRGLGPEGLGDRLVGQAVSGLRVLAGVLGHDVEEEGLDPRAGQVGGDSGPHEPSAENGGFFDAIRHD